MLGKCSAYCSQPKLGCPISSELPNRVQVKLIEYFAKGSNFYLNSQLYNAFLFEFVKWLKVPNFRLYMIEFI